MPYTCGFCHHLSYVEREFCPACGSTDPLQYVTTSDWEKGEIERLSALQGRIAKSVNSLSDLVDEINGFINKQKNKGQ